MTAQERRELVERLTAAGNAIALGEPRFPLAVQVAIVKAIGAEAELAGLNERDEALARAALGFASAIASTEAKLPAALDEVVRRAGLMSLAAAFLSVTSDLHAYPEPWRP